MLDAVNRIKRHFKDCGLVASSITMVTANPLRYRVGYRQDLPNMNLGSTRTIDVLLTENDIELLSPTDEP